MRILKKILIFITVTIMTVVLLSNTINTFASSILTCNNRNILNASVLLWSYEDLFMSQLKQDLEDVQKEHKDNVQFTIYDGKNNVSVQYETIDSILKGNTDVLILILADVTDSIVEDIISKVKQRNIPVILWDINPQLVLKFYNYYDRAVFMLSDAKKGAIAEAEILIDLWNTNKKALDKNGDNILQYVLLEGKVNNRVAKERTKYVISTLNDAGIKTEQLALVNTNWLEEIAKTSIDSLFLKYGDRIEAIIGNNDAVAIGAIKALQKYGYNKGDKTKNIAVVGIDALPEARDLVDKGFMLGTVSQDPKVAAEMLYSVGMNLANNLNPTENTNYKIVNGEMITPYTHEKYIKK